MNHGAQAPQLLLLWVPARLGTRYAQRRPVWKATRSERRQELAKGLLVSSLSSAHDANLLLLVIAMHFACGFPGSQKEVERWSIDARPCLGTGAWSELKLIDRHVIAHGRYVNRRDSDLCLQRRIVRRLSVSQFASPPPFR